MISFVVSAVGSVNSYVRSDGLLIEPFGQIVMGGMFGFIFTVLGIIIGLSYSIWSLFHNPKNIDKYILGIFSALLIITTGYLVLLILFK